MDIEMPIMDGYSAAKELRRLMENKTIPSIPIVAITAFPDQRSKCLQSSMDDFVNKPASAPIIKQILKKHVWK